MLCASSKVENVMVCRCIVAPHTRWAVRRQPGLNGRPRAVRMACGRSSPLPGLSVRMYVCMHAGFLFPPLAPHSALARLRATCVQTRDCFPCGILVSCMYARMKKGFFSKRPKSAGLSAFCEDSQVGAGWREGHAERAPARLQEERESARWRAKSTN